MSKNQTNLSEHFLGFFRPKFERITEMKQPVPAEVALFIHRPYA